MLRLFAVVVPLVTFFGCASGESGNISLTTFFVDSACSLPPTTTTQTLDGGSSTAVGGQWIRGSLEVVSGVKPTFNLGMGLSSTLGGVGNDLTVGGTTLSTAGRDHPILDTIAVTLVTEKDPRLDFGNAVYESTVFVPFDTNNEAWIGFPNIIGPSQQELLANITPDPDVTYEVKAYIEIRGKMSRSGGAISTGHGAFFPIAVSTYAATCAKPGLGVGCFAPGTFGAPACCDGRGSIPGCN